MKYVKTLGLAAVAAAALISLAGVGSASGTVLCHNSETSECKSHWTKGTELDLSLKSGTTSRLTDTSGFITIGTCTEGTAKGTLSNTGGAGEGVGIGVETGGLTWSGCTKATQTLTGGQLEIQHIAGTDEGTVLASGFAVTTQFGEQTCAYGFTATTDIGKFVPGEGGTKGTISINVGINLIAAHSSVSGCPSSGKWTATYTQTTNTDLYVSESSASGTVLCHNSETSECKSHWTKGTELDLSLKSGTTSRLTDTSGFITIGTCTGGTLKGTLSNTGGTGEGVEATVEAGGLTWSGCKAETQTLTGGQLEIQHIAGTDEGTVLASGFAVTTQLGELTCAYGFTAATDIGRFVPGEGGTKGTISINTTVNLFGAHSSEECPPSGKWIASYTQTTNTDLYVSGS